MLVRPLRLVALVATLGACSTDYQPFSQAAGANSGAGATSAQSSGASGGAAGAGATGGSSSASTAGSGGGTSATGTGGAAGGGCAATPVPPGTGGCPDVCDGGCTGNNVCVIECAGSDDCGGTVTCPPGFACEIDCLDQDACDHGQIECPAMYECTLHCMTGDACNGPTTLQCADGPCHIDCGDAACNAVVDCGTGACTCGGMATPDLQCKSDTCLCDPC